MAQSYIVCKWFKANQLSFAFGLNLSLANIATTLNGSILPSIYNDNRTEYLGAALLVGVFFLAFSVVIAFVVGKLTLTFIN